MVDVREIIEDGEVDGEDANLRASDREDWNDGRVRREGCPAEPE